MSIIYSLRSWWAYLENFDLLGQKWKDIARGNRLCHRKGSETFCPWLCLSVIFLGSGSIWPFATKLPQFFRTLLSSSSSSPLHPKSSTSFLHLLVYLLVTSHNVIGVIIVISSNIIVALSISLFWESFNPFKLYLFLMSMIMSVSKIYLLSCDDP